MKQFFEKYWRFFVDSGLILWAITMIIISIVFYFTPGCDPGLGLSLSGLAFVLIMNAIAVLLY